METTTNAAIAVEGGINKHGKQYQPPARGQGKTTNEMETEHLRIDNLILNDRIVNAVKGIHDDSVYLKTPQGNLINARMELIKPIPLTAEWLEKFGFKKVGYNFEKEWLLLHGNLKTGTVDFLLNEPQSGKYKATALEYVHQLQNLYFAITGEELTIKEDTK